MEKTRKQQNNNSRVVEELFSLLFDVVWVPRTDPRGDGVYARFRLRVTELTNMLVRVDVSAADEDFLQQILLRLKELREQLPELKGANVILGRQQAAAEELLMRVSEQIGQMAGRVPAGNP